MTDTEISETVRRCVADALALNMAEISLDSSLVEDLGADSLDFIDILFALEKGFEVKLRSADVDGFLRAEFSESDLIDGKYVPPSKIDKLMVFLPSMRAASDISKVTPAQVYSFITVKTFVLIAASAIQKNFSSPGLHQ